MLSTFTLVTYAVLVGLSVGLWHITRLGQRTKGLPPGPPTLPILGNIHQVSSGTTQPPTGLIETQMPTRDAHVQFQKWAKEYGPIYSLILGSQVLIVLSSHEAVKGN